MVLFTSLLLVMSQPAQIDARLKEIEVASKGKLGAAILTPTSSHYSRKGERFSLQSVMKLMVSAAVLDAADKGKWKLDQKLNFYRSDISISPQPLADRLGKRKSMTTTLSECIEFTLTTSCNASADFMIRKLGGTSALNSFLKKNGITGMRVDRQERELQSNVSGLEWKPEYVDESKLKLAIQKLSDTQRDTAYRSYLADPRDTTTPEAMALLLRKLVTGKLLSPSSTKYLMNIMERTKTGPGRLSAGIPEGWKLAHRTGTSSTHRGLTAATNDVGIARNSSGDWIIIVGLLRTSTLTPEERDNVLCRVAQTAFLK